MEADGRESAEEEQRVSPNRELRKGTDGGRGQEKQFQFALVEFAALSKSRRRNYGTGTMG